MQKLYKVNRAIRGVAVLWGLASLALLMVPLIRAVVG
jgi:hypothetical protein